MQACNLNLRDTPVYYTVRGRWLNWPGIEYELVYGTTFRGDAPSGNSVSMQLTGSNGKTTDVINLPGHR